MVGKSALNFVREFFTDELAVQCLVRSGIEFEMKRERSGKRQAQR
jgi:hypothetical protein